MSRTRTAAAALVVVLSTTLVSAEHVHYEHTPHAHQSTAIVQVAPSASEKEQV